MLLAGQAPNLINYQGSAFDNGAPVTNDTISLRMSILQTSYNGTSAYVETHSVLTNDFGIFSLKIGSGTVISGDITTIDWGADSYYLKTELDPVGGTAYVLMGTTQLLSVPYSLYSQKTETADSLDGFSLDVGTPTNGQALGWNGVSWSPMQLSMPDSTSFVNLIDTQIISGYKSFNEINTNFFRMGDSIVFRSTSNNLSIGEGAGANYHSNAYFGSYAGNKNTHGGNVMVGFSAGKNANYVEGSVFIGMNAGEGSSSTSGIDNVFIGRSSGKNQILGQQNTFIGSYSGLFNNNGSQNVFLGFESGRGNNGSNNVFLGVESGKGNNGNGNVFIGNQAGSNLNNSISNILYIDNSNTTTPLIYGEFNTNRVRINGNFEVTQDVYSENVYVNNDLDVNDDLTVLGTLSKSSGTFKIDHPVDPYNKFLYHSFVESPDMMNIYNGNITTNSNGEVTVELPDYFESLNVEFRYQLTVMGDFAQAIIADEITGNQFKIKTDKPNIKVSWQVTGVRNDTYAKENRVVPVVEKPAEQKGTLLYESTQSIK